MIRILLTKLFKTRLVIELFKESISIKYKMIVSPHPDEGTIMYTYTCMYLAGRLGLQLLMVRELNIDRAPSDGRWPL